MLAGMLVLIVVFLTYRTISTNAKKERRAAKKEERAQREAQGPL
jgi:preprotein translocase subunit Sec63